MNEQTRYVMAIYEIGVIIRDSMEYLIPAPKNGYNVEIYKSRKQMFSHLIEEKSPFRVFCDNNRENTSKENSNQTIGDRISSQVQEFFDDVYGDDSRIVKIDHDAISVESSLSLQMLDYIIGLHETISDICLGFSNQFEKDGNLEDDLKALLNVDDPFYRSIAFRCVASNFVAKFIEYQGAVKSYISSERQKNGIDPTTQAGFDPKVDPSCAFISNEMTRVMGFFNFLKTHNKSTDVIFVDMISKMEDQFHYFDGSKKLAEGQTMQAAMQGFETIFAPVIDSYREVWLKAFNLVFGQLQAYERDMIEKAKAANANVEVKNESEGK